MLILRQYPEQADGFTLIEMLVVLAIMALAAALLIGRQPSNGAVSSAKLIAKVESEITMLRQTAISQNRQQEFIPGKHNLRLVTAKISNSDRLLFYADGSSNGGDLVNSQSDILLSVDWMSGGISRGR